MMMKFFRNIERVNQKVKDYLNLRGNVYKVKIVSTPSNAVIKMEGEDKYFDAYKTGDTLQYEVSLEGYNTKQGTITVEDRDILESVVLEATA